MHDKGTTCKFFLAICTALPFPQQAKRRQPLQQLAGQQQQQIERSKDVHKSSSMGGFRLNYT